MSKSKKRSSSPNVPQAALERARQELGGDKAVKPAEPAEENPAKAQKTPLTPYVAASPKEVSARVRVRSSASRRSETAQPRSSRSKDQPDAEIIKNRLLHPTRVVTEDQFRQEYGYVIHDLRTVAIIAAAMIVLMVVLAQFV